MRSDEKNSGFSRSHATVLAAAFLFTAGRPADGDRLRSSVGVAGFPNVVDVTSANVLLLPPRCFTGGNCGTTRLRQGGGACRNQPPVAVAVFVVAAWERSALPTATTSIGRCPAAAFAFAAGSGDRFGNAADRFGGGKAGRFDLTTGRCGCGTTATSSSLSSSSSSSSPS